LWCLEKGYSQFIDDCPWEELDGQDWMILLSKKPQFSSLCIWDKLIKEDWVDLLFVQPQFYIFCPSWDMLDAYY